jgi:hypothetical protein
MARLPVQIVQFGASRAVREPKPHEQRAAGRRPAGEICETRSRAVRAASGCPLGGKGRPGAGPQVSTLRRQAACWHAVLS